MCRSFPTQLKVIAAAMVLVAAGCGSSGSTSQQVTEEPSEATTTVPATTAAEEPSEDTTTVPDESGPADPGGQMDPALIEDLAAVPLDAIVAAYEANPPENTLRPSDDGDRLTADGHPEVLYIGAEFCPYCAAERWALTVALSKFGDFSDLGMITSSEGDVPTLSYVGSEFSSDHVAFSPVELQDQDGEPLEEATDAQMELFRGLGGGSFPFVDVAGVAHQRGGSVAIPPLVGKTQAEIVGQLAGATADDTDPASIAGTVNASAGAFIQAICDVTDGQPGEVCGAFD